MNEYMPLVTVFVSGFFGLVVALATTYVAHLIENRRHVRDSRRRRRDEIEALYVDTLATLEKAMRETTKLDDYSESLEAFPRVNARLMLTSTPEIIDQYAIVGHCLYEWSTEYRKGSPKRINDTGAALVSSDMLPHSDKAKDLYPKLNAAVVELSQLMTAHINRQTGSRPAASTV